MRCAFRQVLGPAYREEVERITGLKVVTLMSINHAAETFLLDGPVEG